MICPQCEAEYLDGYVECADCRVPLVTPEALAKIKAEMRQAVVQADAVEHVPIRVTADQGQILFLQSVLEGEGIGYYWHSDHASMYQFNSNTQLMMVDNTRLDDLREIFADLDIASDLKGSPDDGNSPQAAESEKNHTGKFTDDDLILEASSTTEATPQQPTTIDDLLNHSNVEGVLSDDDAFEKRSDD